VRILATLFALIALRAAAAPDAATGAATTGTRPFTAKDLVMLDRVSEPRLAPDGRSLAFTLRETDFEGKRGVKSIWKLDLADKAAHPQRLTAAGSDAWSARGEPISVEALIKKAIFRVIAQGGAGRTGIEHDTLSETD
jgi:dipeptidyl aminopeptidase/acylaminoacyl peptidase